MANPNPAIPTTTDRASIMEEAGLKLKKARLRMRLTFRDVEEVTSRIAALKQNEEYVVSVGRLGDIEKRGGIPSIHRLYSLCVIYRLDFNAVLGWYGIRSSELLADSRVLDLKTTHLYAFDIELDGKTQVPFELDPGLDLTRTVFLSRMIQEWGKLPIAMLRGLDLKGHRYGFMGTDDWSMYPILLPGSLLLIDETDREIVNSGWRDEYERPIYLFEHETGYTCSWCSRVGEQLVLLPHTLSGADPLVFSPEAVEIIGRVDGVAMRLNPLRRRHTRS